MTPTDERPGRQDPGAQGNSSQAAGGAARDVPHDDDTRKAYWWDAKFEKEVVALSCCDPTFLDSAGFMVEPDGLKNPVAKLALEAAQAVRRETGRAPTSRSIVTQRLHRRMNEGKVTKEEIDQVQDFLDDMTEAGLPDAKSVKGQLIPIIRRRLQHALIRTAQAEYAAKRDFSAVRDIQDKIDALGTEKGATAPQAVLTSIESIEAQPIHWLWPGRIPRGKVTLLEGHAKVGKSVLSVDIAARVSAGAPMPGEAEGEEAGHVVILSAEDDVGDTVRPRLEGAGADLSRCHILRMRAPDGEERLPDIDPSDLAECEKCIEEKQAVLFVLDPLFAFLPPKVDAYKDAHVRRALAPLHALSERTGCATVVIRHPRKNNANSPAVHAGGGSVGIVGAARSVLLAAKHPEDDTGRKRILAVTGCNVAAPAPSLEFEIVEALIHGPDGLDIPVAKIEWGGETHYGSDELLQPPEAPEMKSAVDEAWEFLETVVPAWRPVKEVQAEARQAGISWDSIRRALKRQGVKPKKRPGKDGPWELPPLGKGEDAEGRCATSLPFKSSPPSTSSTSSPSASSPRGEQGVEDKEGKELLEGGRDAHLPPGGEVSP